MVHALDAEGPWLRGGTPGLSLLNLADAYRYSGDFAEARRINTLLLRVLNKDASIEKERLVQGEWTYNYMPVEPGDRETIKNYLLISDMQEKKALAYYSLSLSHALLGELAEADTVFEQALQLEQRESFKDFIHNKLESTVGLTDPPEEVRSWLLTHAKLLMTPATPAAQPERHSAPAGP